MIMMMVIKVLRFPGKVASCLVNVYAGHISPATTTEMGSIAERRRACVRTCQLANCRLPGNVTLIPRFPKLLPRLLALPALPPLLLHSLEKGEEEEVAGF